MATVGEIMTGSVFSIDPAMTVAEAATVMGERKIGSALVLEGEELKGIFTERDIVRALGEHFDAAGHPVSEWMTANPMTVTRETTVQDALNTMLERGFRHLPVVEGEQILGIVSMRDLTRAGIGGGSG
ncbi:MAG: CBS domain-containing protein [Actinomycetota bacterium]